MQDEREVTFDDEFQTDLEAVLEEHEDLHPADVVMQLMATAYSIMVDTAPSVEEGHVLMQNALAHFKANIGPLDDEEEV